MQAWTWFVESWLFFSIFNIVFIDRRKNTKISNTKKYKSSVRPRSCFSLSTIIFTTHEQKKPIYLINQPYGKWCLLCIFFLRFFQAFFRRYKWLLSLFRSRKRIFTRNHLSRVVLIAKWTVCVHTVCLYTRLLTGTWQMKLGGGTKCEWGVPKNQQLPVI